MISSESFKNAVETGFGSVLIQLALTESFRPKLTASALDHAKLFAQNLVISEDKSQTKLTKIRALVDYENCAAMQSFFSRTTLDERIFAKTGGTELINVARLHHFLPFCYGSIRNMISQGTFFLELVEVKIENKKKNFVRTSDLVKLIESGGAKQKKIGKKSA